MTDSGDQERFAKLVRNNKSDIMNHMNIEEDSEAAYWLNILEKGILEDLEESGGETSVCFKCGSEQLRQGWRICGECYSDEVNSTSENSVEPPKPDAWQNKQDAYYTHPSEKAHSTGKDKGYDDNYKPLYSSKTIQETIQRMKEEMGEKPSKLDRLDRNAWKERRQTLKELEQVFFDE